MDTCTGPVGGSVVLAGPIQFNLNWTKLTPSSWKTFLQTTFYIGYMLFRGHANLKQPWLVKPGQILVVWPKGVWHFFTYLFGIAGGGPPGDMVTSWPVSELRNGWLLISPTPHHIFAMYHVPFTHHPQGGSPCPEVALREQCGVETIWTEDVIGPVKASL